MLIHRRKEWLHVHLHGKPLSPTESRPKALKANIDKCFSSRRKESRVTESGLLLGASQRPGALLSGFMNHEL